MVKDIIDKLTKDFYKLYYDNVICKDTRNYRAILTVHENLLSYIVDNNTLFEVQVVEDEMSSFIQINTMYIPPIGRIFIKVNNNIKTYEARLDIYD